MKRKYIRERKKERKNDRKQAELSLPDQLDEPLLQCGLGVDQVFDLGSHFDLLRLSGRLNLLHLLLQLVPLSLHVCQSLLHAGPRKRTERRNNEEMN